MIRQNTDAAENAERGYMVLSLDFELMWGILDRKEPFAYRSHILGARKAVPALLHMFDQYRIHATWGIVGMMAKNSIRECISQKPEQEPAYDDPNLSAYEHLKSMRGGVSHERLLFAPGLIQEIQRHPFQETASHTYSHYYCCEPGQTKEQFAQDIRKAKEACQKYGCEVYSIIFPRNERNARYDDVLEQEGIKNYRGNEKHWIYSPGSRKEMNAPLKRLFRLLDAYVNLAGFHCYSLDEINEHCGKLRNIRSSRFLRPYVPGLKLLEPLRIRRVKGQMKYAATHGKVFHLWWHPHNFGVNQKQNFQNLDSILRYYQKLNREYGFLSVNMGEMGELCQDENISAGGQG